MRPSEYSESQFLENYPVGIENHFWHLARNRLIAATLHRTLPAAGRILEIGCGPAIVLRHLRNSGFDCWGSELGAPPLPEPLRPFVFLQQDCFQLDPDFRRSIDAVLLFDVLEHIEGDIAFLRQLAEAFPNSRALVLTVPARAELWSNYDEHYGHFRRYDRAGLSSVLQQGGFTVQQSRYFFQELYLPALFTTKILRKRETKLGAPSMLPLHRLLARVSGLCTSALPPGIPGMSLIAVATAERGGEP
jgi:SAM-dependent methyltransferase